ncbi:MAG: DegV family protein, partial [Anaerolineae bacterium]
MSIAIVTDSTADLPADLCERYNIEVIPALVVMDGESYRDGIDISRREFYQRLSRLRGPATTATPSPGVFQEVYERLLSQGAQRVLSIHIARPLSGMVDTASMAAREFGQRVQIWDSRSLSMGLGFQVLAAAESAQAGMSLGGIQEKLHDLIGRIRVIAMLDTLEHVRRSGRVSWITARLGSLLRVKLFVEVTDGAVLNLGQARTRAKGIAHLKSLLRGLMPVERLAIL